MKILKFTGLLLSMLMISSCTDKDKIEIPEVIFAKDGGDELYYQLYLSFQDVSGYDLVRGIVDENIASGIVNSDLYTLEVSLEEGMPNILRQNLTLWFWWGELFEIMELDIAINGNYDYLMFNFISYATRRPETPFPEKVTFTLKCPYLFGDNEAHDIVTWWELIENIASPVCYRIEYNGKVFSVEEQHVATIVLEDK